MFLFSLDKNLLFETTQLEKSNKEKIFKNLIQAKNSLKSYFDWLESVKN